MATYFIVKVIHRLDGTVVVKGVLPWNQRRVVFRLERAPTTAILPGKTYSVRRSQESIDFTLTSTSAAQWHLLVKHHFYLPELYLPRREQVRLLALSTQGISAALLALEQQDHRALCMYISEPYASQLAYHFHRQSCLVDAATFMLDSGFCHYQALHICHLHGPEGTRALFETPAKAFPFLGIRHLQDNSSTAGKLATTPSYQLIARMLAEAKCGATVLNALDLPASLRSALSYCLDNHLVVRHHENIQLMGQHLIQSSIRSQLQTLAHAFFPTYSDREIEYAYIRYSSLYGAFNDSDHGQLVNDAINSRFSIFTYSGNESAASFCDEFSAILQILGGAEPSIVHQGLAGQYGSEAQLVHWESIPDGRGEYRTFIVWDFQWYSTVEVSLLLGHFTPRDRVVFLCNQITAVDDSLNSHMVNQLQGYFPNHHIEPPPGAISSPPSDHSSLDRAVAGLKADPTLVAICDSYQLCMVINELVRKRGNPVALETQWDTYSKGDRLLLKQTLPKRVSCGRLISTDDRGLRVETQGRHWRIDTETVRESVCTRGAAMTIDDALHAGVRRAMVVAGVARMSGLARAVEEYGVDLVGAFAHNLSEAGALVAGVSMQRITPTVE
ncbi:hypothetical protein [Pseudomonas chlororaphis]|uniref:hypothetical protein n=1 Tax=Pseudomonas chlororaphis TaxID=587753 RepID=UPI002D787CEE|nr:hypothetical protein [Pseudomonas chlororaphis]